MYSSSTQKLRIQAQLSIYSRLGTVLMAEAAALTLAAQVSKLVSINQVNFLTGDEAMANFYNSNDLSNPPHWNIKRLTADGYILGSYERLSI